MPYIFHRISRRQFLLFDYIRLFHADCKHWPTLENTCLYFNSNPLRTRVSLMILERHHLIEEIGGRFHVVDRHPLLMPFRGTVK